MVLAGIEFDERSLIKRVMMNIKRPPKGTYSAYRWAVVMDTFGCGSSVAQALCVEFDLDPDEILK